MKQVIIIFTLLAASICPLSARNISGTVLSDNDSTAVTGAICRLKQADKLLAGKATDADGTFSFDTPSKSALAIEIGLTGYSTTEILIDAGNRDIDLGLVFLSESLELGEVSVTAQSMVDSRGRTIVFPSAADVSASATSISLLQKLPMPGMEANPINRSLTVDGGSPMILIDGVPSTIDDVNALQPKEISRIEYSRLTPARYADRGVSGLISITLKKRNDGGNFYGWGRSAVSTAFVDANIRASYHQGPSQFAIYYSPSWRNYQKVYDNNRQSYVGDDFRVDLNEHDRNPFNYFGNPIKAKYDFRPSEKTLLSVTFNASVMTNRRRYIGETTDSELGDYSNHNLSHGKQFAPSLDLFLRHDFNENNSLEAQVVGTISSDDYRRDNVYIFDDASSESYVMNVDNRRRSLISEISYTHSFSDKTSLSAGYQNTVSHSKNSYLTTDYKPILTENNNYVYAKVGQQAGNIYLSLATGAKLYWVKNDLNKRNFVRNLTTVQASWNINPKWDLAAAFQYSPRIPSLSSLTDYRQQTSPYLISNGNPDLKVAENFTWQAMPSFRYKKFASSLLLTLTNIKNRVISDLIYLGDGMFLSQSVNSRHRRTYTGSLNLKISDVAGFGANANIAFERYESAGEGWSHQLNTFSGSISLWWNNGPYTISFWQKFPGKYLSGHGVYREENGNALGFSYQPDKHWTLGVDWMYLFERKGTKYPSWGYSAVNPSKNERYIKNNANMVVLSVSYSADFGTIFRAGRRTLNNSDNGSSLLKL